MRWAAILALVAAAGCRAPQTTPQADAVSLEPSWTLSGLADPESVAVGPDGTTLYVANVSGEGDARDGRGFISRVSRDGRMLEREWVKGLDAPKGAAISGGTLFVTDIDKLVIIELETGTVQGRVAAPDAGFLNDVEIDVSGAVLVSDSARGRIYRLEDGVLRVWAEGPDLKAVNGLLAERDRVIAATMEGKLLALDYGTGAAEVLAEGLGQADGVAALGGGRYLVSEWPGRLFEVERDGAHRVLLDVRSEGRYLNDFILVGDDLVVPNWKPGALSAYRIRR